jgi:proteasome accessory factor C
VFRLTRIRGKVGYSSKAEHDFPPPENFDPRIYATRAPWQLGDSVGSARVWISGKVDWYVMRHYGDAGTSEPAPDGDGVIFETDYAEPRAIVSWVLGLREHARILDPPELAEEEAQRLARIVELHSTGPELAPPARSKPAAAEDNSDANGRRETLIRPERFARLVTLAGILIEAARSGSLLSVAHVCESLQVSDEELREDIDVLNVVNFGGGSYVLYAEIHGDSIEVDPEPYGDNFAQPARLLPLEAKALVAAIDFIGEHVPEGSLASAREKIVDALGEDPAQEGLRITNAAGDDSAIARVVSAAIAEHRVLEIDYYKEDEDEVTEGRRIEPYLLHNGNKGWYIHSWDPAKGDTRTFRLDRIREARITGESFEPRADLKPDVPEWTRTDAVEGAQACQVWFAPERARWAREGQRVIQELKDGAVIVEILAAGNDWLAREILEEAGDAAVLEPEEARAAVLEAAEALAVSS